MRGRSAGLLAFVIVMAAGCGGGSSHLPKPRVPDDEPETAATPPKPPAAKAAARTPAAAAEALGQAATLPAAAAAPTAAVLKPPAGSEPVPQTQAGETEQREATLRRLRQLQGWFHAFRGQGRNYETYPGPYTRPGLSWRVEFVFGAGEEYEAAAGAFRPKEAWDSPQNRLAARKVPDVFASSPSPNGKTNLVLITGPNTIYREGKLARANDCPDGLENTILALAVSDEFAAPWTAPQDYVFSTETAQQAFFGLYKDCCYALFGGDTGVRRIPANISDENLLALVTPDGGEPVDVQAVTRVPTANVDSELLAHLKEYPVVRFVAKPGTASTAAATPSKPGERVGASPTVEASSAVPPAGLRPTARLPGEQPAAGSAVGTVSEAATPAELSDRRLPVPDDEALRRATAVFREIYADLLKVPKASPERRALAKKMFDQSGGLAADPAGMFVLLRAARDVAAEAGDVDTAFHAILEMAATFRVDPLPMQSKVLEQAGTGAQGAADWETIYRHAVRLGDQALAKDDFVNAQRLFALAQNIARRDGRREDLVLLRSKIQELDQFRAAKQRIRDQAYALVQNPDDPAANAAVGKYLCLVKRDWERGLDRLIRGDDAALRRLAHEERRAPRTGEQMRDLADHWWDWAETAGLRVEQANARLRAAEWYRKALPAMGDSLLKARVEQRIAQVESELSRASTAAVETSRKPEG